MVENGGVGEKIMELSWTETELFDFFVCPYMGIWPYMGIRMDIKMSNNSASVHDSLIIFSPIPPFSTT